MPQPECPDILGAITPTRANLNGNRLQCAVGVHPTRSTVGQPFELLVLLQNATDRLMDVSITLRPPQKDRAGNRLSFSLPRAGFNITLQPIEVGVAHLPIVTQPPTPAGQSYPLLVEIAVQTDPKGHIIRPAAGGRPPTLLSVSPIRLKVLREIKFTAAERQPNQLMTSIEIMQGQFLLGKVDIQPKYETLWSMQELKEELEVAESIRPIAREYANTVTRQIVTKPLLNLINERFAAANMTLHPAEALMISKLMTYVMEDGLELEAGFGLENGKWFKTLCSLMASDKNIVKDTNRLLEQLFLAVIWDAVMLGLYICNVNLKVEVGDENERAAYAIQVQEALSLKSEMTLSHVYLPLVMGGIIQNANVRLLHEVLHDNLNKIEEAVRWRESQAPEGYEEIFELTRRLIENGRSFLLQARLN